MPPKKEEFVTTTDLIRAVSGVVSVITKEKKQKEEVLAEIESRIDEVASQIPALRRAVDGEKGERGDDGVNGIDGKDYVLTEQDKEDIAKSIKVPVIDKIIEKTETIVKEVPIVTNEIVEVAVINSDELPQYGTKFRDGLELLQGEERLKATAIDGLDKEVTDRAISIVDNRTSYLLNRINNLSSNGNATSNTFETVSKNLDASGATLVYTGENLTSITYLNGIIKTLAYTGDNLTSVVLSGSTPAGINLTKTLSYTGDNLTGVSYT